jgi:hypothetical protein
MKRIAPALFAACALCAPAAAQLGTRVPDCERGYRQVWLGVLPAANKDLTGTQLAELHRYALRAYEGCTSGDERASAEDVFKRLARVRPGHADAWLREMKKPLQAK